VRPRNKIEQLTHQQYLIDYYGCYSTASDAHLAVIILNRNLPTVTNHLCESIIRTTHVPFDLYVTESGSDHDNLSSYCSLHFVDQYSTSIGLRIGRGLNNSIAVINKIRQRPYDVYWFITNDVVLTSAEDYGRFATFVFEQYPRIGIIELPHLVNEYYTLSYLDGSAYQVRLTSSEMYPDAIRERLFSITPFAIIRSIFLKGDFVRDMAVVIDESNWRGWGCDEDLGYRAWKKGWWSVTAPYHSIYEDSCLTTRRSTETKTEHVDQFKLKAEIDMQEFLRRKYHTDVRGFRRMIIEEMLPYLDDFDRLGIAIAHGYPGNARTIYNLIEAQKRLEKAQAE
jgi:hypothetical protein